MTQGADLTPGICTCDITSSAKVKIKSSVVEQKESFSTKTLLEREAEPREKQDKQVSEKTTFMGDADST